MSKFEKRLRKSSTSVDTAIVIGTAFGHLGEILSIYKTVFVISPSPPDLKSKNLIYRENFNNLEQLGNISTIFVDKSQIHYLSLITPLGSRNRASVLVEGNEPIGRDLSGPLYASGYRCTDLQGLYHVWKI